jgi:DNA-binding PadR family transcriptional regulator
MKTVKCDICDHEEGAETFEEWMELMKPHYTQAHADFMKQQGERSAEEQQSEMQKWMAENKTRFEAA